MKMFNPLLKTASLIRIKTLQRTNPDATPRTRGRAWMERKERWLRAHPVCAGCERNGVMQLADEVDHITPLIDGGADDESNYQSLCCECHKAKTAEENSRRARHGY